MSFRHFFLAMVLLTFVENLQQTNANNTENILLRQITSSSNSEYPGFIKIGKYSGVENGKAFDKFYWYPEAYKERWIHAKLLCNNNGLQLITLDSQDEANNFWAIFQANANLLSEYTILGAVTPLPKSKTEWYWVENNKKINIFLNWGSGQPDNYLGLESCLLMKKTTSGPYIYDGKCSNGDFHRFICQSYVWR